MAAREPHKRIVHGDTVLDEYAWLSRKDDTRVRAYVDAQNAYGDARMKHLAGLRSTLFAELSSRIEETDMSVPVRMDGYWYFTRTREGQQYGIQCRMPIRGEDDWDPPQIDPQGVPGSAPGEGIVFDTNAEAQGHDFFRIGGMDVSVDGRWLLYGVDANGDERYDFRIRDLHTGQELPERFAGIGGACFTPDASWVFYVVLDDAWRPYAVRRHRVGTPVADDVEVFREDDERFWVGVGLSFDERMVVIGTGSKTTSEVLMLPVDTPTGEFKPFIARQEGIEYDVSFACFEGADEQGGDIPVAVVFHNATNPNFVIDVIDMRSHKPPYRLGEGVCIAQGSPYGCELGDAVEAGASHRAVGEPYDCQTNPALLRGLGGLAIEGIALHRHFVVLRYRAQSLPHIAVMTKEQAARDFLSGEPWHFVQVAPPALADDWDNGASAGAGAGADTSTDACDGISPDGTAFDGVVLEPVRRLYSIGTSGNPSYDAPGMRYAFSSYTRPGELRELDPATGRDVLLKRSRVLGGFDARAYRERRLWVRARDGESIPVSLVWHSGYPLADETRPVAAPMFVTGYGAYEISSDPGFSVARLSMLDRGVLYVVPHIRGGGEMGRAWYEQGRRLRKRHTFEDFVDVVRAVQRIGFADAARTVANGGSAGGLLMGAVANMAPECFAGIEADVPFVDALNTILDPSLPLTVTEWDEWGDPLHDEQVYRYMKSYTPYENVPDDAAGGRDSADAWSASRAFPKIFVTSSLNDTRVLVAEPLKWLARLQAAGVDAVAHIEVEAGHGGTSGRYRQWEQMSYENAWCLDVMGCAEVKPLVWCSPRATHGSVNRLV